MLRRFFTRQSGDTTTHFSRLELLWCMLKRHVTYNPTDDEAARRRLHTRTELGDAWRCLRCGSFVLGQPAGSGPAGEAPIVFRGKALRSAVILRSLAVERFFRGLVLVALAYLVWRLQVDQAHLQQVFAVKFPILHDAATQLHYDIDQSAYLSLVRKVLFVNTTTLMWAKWGLLAYGLSQLVEGVGLWKMWRWGEYFAAVVTTLFIPLEVYEIMEKTTITRILLLAINIAAVAYLVFSKRLFGVRGGAKKYHESLHEQSLLEVAQASGGDHETHGSRAGGTKS